MTQHDDGSVGFHRNAPRKHGIFQLHSITRSARIFRISGSQTYPTHKAEQRSSGHVNQEPVSVFSFTSVQSASQRERKKNNKHLRGMSVLPLELKTGAIFHLLPFVVPVEEKWHSFSFISLFVKRYVLKKYNQTRTTCVAIPLLPQYAPHYK